MSPLKFDSEAYIRASDYEIIAGWWRDTGVEPMPFDAMPALGSWALDGGNRQACAFAYMTDSNLAILAFAISNPHSHWKMQAASVAFAVATLAKLLRDTNPNIVLIALSHDVSMHQTYVKRAGFHDTGKVSIAVSAPLGASLDILTE